MAPDTTTALLPRYYLEHMTPNGPRVAYPAPKLDNYPYHNPTEVTWHSGKGEQLQVVGGWLIGREPFEVVQASWLPPKQLGDWTKRPEAPTDPIELGMWRASPDRPQPEMLTHYGSYGCDRDDSCLTCMALRVVYTREQIQPPPQITLIDMTGWSPLTGELDPDPSVPWMLDDTSLLSIYGPHTGHLWPGYIPGFRDRVYELLKKDPRVKYVFDAKNHPSTQPRGTLQTTVPIPWSAPRTRLRDRTGAGGRKLGGKETVPDPIAHSAQTTLPVPTSLSGPSKTAVMAVWESSVADYLTQLVPVNVVACNHCDGHGHLLDECATEGD